MDKKPFISLKVRISIGVVSVCLLLGLLAVLLMSRIARDIVDEEYIDDAEKISRAVVSALDVGDVKELTDIVMGIYEDAGEVVPSTEWGSDAWNKYMSNFEGVESLPVFGKLRKQLRVYQEIFDVDCIYIMQFNKAGDHAIYIIDAAYENVCPPGVVDSYAEGFWPDSTGRSIPTTITNEERYGWLVTAAYPVMLDDEVVAFLCVDISMNEIKANERDYVFMTGIAMALFTLVVLVFSLIYLNRNIFGPVALLKDTAKNYCSESGEIIHHEFEKLSVRNNDEISDLLLSMKQMEADMNANITALMDTKVALKATEEKASTMEALAVKDTLTGIWNRLAYEDEIKKLNKDIREGFTEFGIAMIDLNDLKKINDTYGHENGNVAIRGLSSIICDVFKRSRVFRIGGDEFVVILKKKDFKNVDKRMEDFNDRLVKIASDSLLMPWEKVSAAIGYAMFDDDEDVTAEDVFKKADKAMYERKAAMKAGRTL